MNTTHVKKEGRPLLIAMTGIGAAIGVWALVAFTMLLAQMEWSLGEVFRQYLVATGAMNEQETLVEYYTHIKGVEYIICAAFFFVFPAYYKYVNREKAPLKA